MSIPINYENSYVGVKISFGDGIKVYCSLGRTYEENYATALSAVSLMANLPRDTVEETLRVNVEEDNGVKVERFRSVGTCDIPKEKL
jgi:hypothetical protein